MESIFVSFFFYFFNGSNNFNKQIKVLEERLLISFLEKRSSKIKCEKGASGGHWYQF